MFVKKEEKKEMTTEFKKCVLSRHTFINAELLGRIPKNMVLVKKELKKLPQFFK